jgi:hypothetical protein
LILTSAGEGSGAFAQDEFLNFAARRAWHLIDDFQPLRQILLGQIVTEQEIA